MTVRKISEEIWDQAIIDMCGDDDGNPSEFVPLRERAISFVTRMIQDGYNDNTDYTEIGFGPGLGNILIGGLDEAEEILSQFDGGRELLDYLNDDNSYIV